MSRVQRPIFHSGATTSRKSAVNGNRTKWELPSNRLPQRHRFSENQTVIRMQVDALLKLGVIEESRATHWRLEGLLIPNIQQTLSRLGTMKPTVFGLLDFTVIT